MARATEGARLRAHVARGLARVLADDGPALTPALWAGITPRHAPLAQELLYGTVRFLLRLDAIARAQLSTPLRARDADVRALLLLGLYQLLYLRIPAHAAVAETVSATEVLGKAWAKALVNAVLRGVQRMPAAALAAIDADPAARLSHPAWLLDHVRRDWPNDWEALAQANNARAPMTLRVNLRRLSRERYLERLSAADIAARALPDLDAAVTLTSPVDVGALPGFAEGEVSVQDAAAQWAAPLLAAAPGEHVLDAAAAPGGKAAHLLERTPDLTLLALDREPARLARVNDTFARLGLAATVRAADATAPDTWWDGAPFARILIDAPCSGTGVIRRHPDIKLRRREADLAKLTETQSAMLNALWPLLARGGRLMYATCSVLRAENDAQVRRFLAGHADAVERRTPIPGAVACDAGQQILTGTEGMDGFYYACLDKR